MSCINRIWITVGAVVATSAFTTAAPAQFIEVKSHQKISDTEGGFEGQLGDGDEFGITSVGIGDLDGDGVGDIAAAARFDDDGGTDHGAVWILFLKTDGTVKAHQKISDTAGGFEGDLDASDNFGRGLAHLGDLDGDGVGDLAVGAVNDDDGGSDKGAVWILFLNTDGTVKAHQKISDTAGGFTGDLDVSDQFSWAVGVVGDLDGDGVVDLAVTAGRDDDGGGERGAIWILFLNTDGTVKSHQKISDTEGGFDGKLTTGPSFGSCLASVGDLNDDGVLDLAAGDRGSGDGAMWILFLRPDGTVKAHQKISETEGGFTGKLQNGALFGILCACIGDRDGDGNRELAVGAREFGDRGRVWILFLNDDGTVRSHERIGQDEGGFTGLLDDGDHFEMPIAIGDVDDDGVDDLGVGAYGDDDGGPDRGAVWILFLNGSDDLLAPLVSFSVFRGELLGGDLQSLEASDDDYVEIDAELVNLLQPVYLSNTLIRATSPATTVSRLDLTVETGVDAAPVLTRVLLRNFDTGDWDLLDGFRQSEADSETMILDVPNPNAYVHDTHGQIAVRIETRANEAQVPDGYVFRIDQVELTVTTGEGGGIAGGDADAFACDLDGDGTVGTTDLLLLLGAWGLDPGGPPDFDGDGNVGTSDLIELLGNWGPCPK